MNMNERHTVSRLIRHANDYVISNRNVRATGLVALEAAVQKRNEERANALLELLFSIEDARNLFLEQD